MMRCIILRLLRPRMRMPNFSLSLPRKVAVTRTWRPHNKTSRLSRKARRPLRRKRMTIIANEHLTAICSFRRLSARGKVCGSRDQLVTGEPAARSTAVGFSSSFPTVGMPLEADRVARPGSFARTGKTSTYPSPFRWIRRWRLSQGSIRGDGRCGVDLNAHVAQPLR